MTFVRGFGVPAIAICVALLAGCGSTAYSPDPESRRVLAPTGKLRVGLYPGTPTSMVKDPASGEIRGVAYDLGRELARRLGVPFEPVVFPRNAEVLDAAKAGRVDLVFTNATPVRAKDLDFTAAVLDVEQGYLVPPGSPISGVVDVDRPGIRVGVSPGSTSQGVLSRSLKQAAVVPAPTLKAAVEWLAEGKLDAFATNKATLFEMGDGLRGSRVLDGRWGLEHFALGIPKGREQAMPYLRQFADAMTMDGDVSRAVERAGLRGTVPAQAK